MRSRAVLAVLVMVLSTLPMLVGQGLTSSASATDCTGEWNYKTRIVKQNKKDLSSVYSKRNSNRTESSELRVGLTSETSDSSAITVGENIKISDVISSVEAKFEVTVTRSVSSGLNVTNVMEVMPLHFGRTKWQTVRTVFERFRFRWVGPTGDCRKERDTIWKARLITSKVHFAECQDKTNTCTPW